MTAVVIALGFVVALLLVLVVGLLRSHAEILRALHDLQGGAPARLDPSRVRVGVALPRGEDAEARATDLIGVTPDGDAVKVAVQGSDQYSLLLFLSSGCMTCRSFWDAAADVRTMGLRPEIRPVLVTKGPEDESLSSVAALAPGEVLTVMTSEAWESYDVPVAPYALLVDPGGRIIGEGAAATWPQVRELMHQAMDDADRGMDEDLRRRVEALRRRRGATGDRDARTDETLLRAGIGPDHPSLWPGGRPGSGGGS